MSDELLAPAHPVGFWIERTYGTVPMVDIFTDNSGQWLSIPIRCPACMGRIDGIVNRLDAEDDRSLGDTSRVYPRLGGGSRCQPCDHQVTVTILNVGDCW